MNLLTFKGPLQHLFQVVAICCKNKKREDKVKAFVTRPGTISSQPPTYRTFQASQLCIKVRTLEGLLDLNFCPQVLLTLNSYFSSLTPWRARTGPGLARPPP